jgi:hypothetical protein
MSAHARRVGLRTSPLPYKSPNGAMDQRVFFQEKQKAQRRHKIPVWWAFIRPFNERITRDFHHFEGANERASCTAYLRKSPSPTAPDHSMSA